MWRTSTKLQYSVNSGKGGDACSRRAASSSGDDRLQRADHQRRQVHHEQRPRRVRRERPALPAGPDEAGRAGAASQPHPGDHAIHTVVIDPGHGGYDHGATSIYGNEKDFALDTGLRLRELLLRKGLKSR